MMPLNACFRSKKRWISKQLIETDQGIAASHKDLIMMSKKIPLTSKGSGTLSNAVEQARGCVRSMMGRPAPGGVGLAPAIMIKTGLLTAMELYTVLGLF
jgi:ribonucleotide monophosphatase NagD (HAD superfamily)